MNTQWFLGANTAEGFASYYDTLAADSAVKELIVLKGGPGCGKSTFMKKLRATAQQYGENTQSFLCSSDPDSLDGLLIPSIGFAVVDGTSPHVIEPKLCGCDGIYLNLGCFYDTVGVRTQKETLQLLQAENKAHYPSAYSHLAAAAALRRCCAEACQTNDSGRLSALMQTLIHNQTPEHGGTGKHRRLFLHSFTPKGELCLTKSLLGCAKTIVAVVDPYAISQNLFSHIESSYLAANYDVVSCMDPLAPNCPEAILIPQTQTAYLRCDRPINDCSVQILISQYYDLSPDAEKLMLAVREHCQNAVLELAKAKSIHDSLEEAYRPYVSFEGLDLITLEYQKKIKEAILSR